MAFSDELRLGPILQNTPPLELKGTLAGPLRPSLGVAGRLQG